MSAAITCQQRVYGTLATGESITCYSLRNPSGMIVQIINYGATLNSVQIPDSRGNMHEIGLGFSSLDEYTRHECYPGMLLGKVQGLHPDFIKVLSNTVWQAENFSTAEASGVKLNFKGMIESDNTSKSGFSLAVEVTYLLTATNELIMNLSATTDCPSPLEFNHQPHWNLSGAGQGDILGHVVQVWANTYANVNDKGLISGEALAVKDTHFNFLQPQHIGDHLLSATEASEDYDICFYLNKEKDGKPITTPHLATRIKEPMSGRTLEIYTTQSGLRLCPGMPREYQITEGASAPKTYNRLLLEVKNQQPVELGVSVEGNKYRYGQETRYKLIW